MPHSDGANKGWSLEKIKEINPRTILDCGTGSGIYSDIIKENFKDSIVLDGIEVWQPYIDEYSLKDKYNSLTKIDVRKHENFNYDLVIFGDILEHMSKEDALSLWGKVSKQAKYAIIAIPIIHYPQGSAFGNPYEVHVKDDWTVQEVLDSFTNIIEYSAFDITAAFLAKFD